MGVSQFSERRVILPTPEHTTLPKSHVFNPKLYLYVPSTSLGTSPHQGLVGVYPQVYSMRSFQIGLVSSKVVCAYGLRMVAGFLFRLPWSMRLFVRLNVLWVGVSERLSLNATGYYAHVRVIGDYSLDVVRLHQLRETHAKEDYSGQDQPVRSHQQMAISVSRQLSFEFSALPRSDEHNLISPW